MTCDEVVTKHVFSLLLFFKYILKVKTRFTIRKLSSLLHCLVRFCTRHRAILSKGENWNFKANFQIEQHNSGGWGRRGPTAMPRQVHQGPSSDVLTAWPTGNPYCLYGFGLFQVLMFSRRFFIFTGLKQRLTWKSSLNLKSTNYNPADWNLVDGRCSTRTMTSTCSLLW